MRNLQNWALQGEREREREKEGEGERRVTDGKRGEGRGYITHSGSTVVWLSQKIRRDTGSPPCGLKSWRLLYGNMMCVSL